MKTIFTHSGSFHADDVFAIATFQLLFGKENINVVRTRDDEVIATAEYVVDIGLIYDHDKKRYDHHQPGAPVRENGVPYAAFGLVWKHYGEEITGSAEVAQKIEEKLCWPVDLADNAIKVWESGKYDIRPFEFDGVLKAWQAEPSLGEDPDEHFMMAVDVARAYLERLIIKQKIKVERKKIADELYAAAEDKKIIMHSEYISRSLFVDYGDVDVVVFPREDTGDWMAVLVQIDKEDFATRVRFPESWAGLRDGELDEASGLTDTVFCHKDRYMFIAKSQETVLAAAKRAI